MSRADLGGKVPIPQKRYSSDVWAGKWGQPGGERHDWREAMAIEGGIGGLSDYFRTKRFVNTQRDSLTPPAGKKPRTGMDSCKGLKEGRDALKEEKKNSVDGTPIGGGRSGPAVKQTRPLLLAVERGKNVV